MEPSGPLLCWCWFVSAVVVVFKYVPLSDPIIPPLWVSDPHQLARGGAGPTSLLSSSVLGGCQAVDVPNMWDTQLCTSASD